MEEKILEEKGILEQTLEGFRQRDCKTSLALVASKLFQSLQGFAHLEPLRRILILRFFGSARRGKGVIDLLERTLEMEHVSGIALEDV